MQITIWHNPRCSKSRQTLKLLEDRGVDPEIRRYLEDSPSAQEIRDVLKQLGIGADKLVRRQEKLFKELTLDSQSTEDELIEAMASHPKLIERPVVITPNGAALGRPPEAVLEIL